MSKYDEPCPSCGVLVHSTNEDEHLQECYPAEVARLRALAREMGLPDGVYVDVDGAVVEGCTSISVEDGRLILDPGWDELDPVDASVDIVIAVLARAGLLPTPPTTDTVAFTVTNECVFIDGRRFLPETTAEDAD